MKYVFSVIALCSASILSADQYSRNMDGRQVQQPYYQGSDQNSQSNYQKQNRNQGSNQNQYGTDTQADNSDQKIYKKIQNALSGGWFSKGYPNVAFDVYNGNVTLRGSVETMDAKNKVEDSIKKIDGVNQINSRITIEDTKSDNRYTDARSNNPDSRSNYSDSRSNNPNSRSNYSDSRSNYFDSRSNNPDSRSNYSDSNRYSDSQSRSNYADAKSNRYSDSQSKSNSYFNDNYSDSDLQESEKKYSRDSAVTNQDRQLNAKIRDKLSGWFSDTNETIILRTANGIVIISGTVDKPEDIQKVHEKIKNIEGVKNVNIQLTAKNR